jgi:hypothetical protein
MIIPKADESTGNCLPVLSCLFLDHLLNIKLDIIAKIIAIKIFENPLSNTGLGEYIPLLEIKNIPKKSTACLILGS